MKKRKIKSLIFDIGGVLYLNKYSTNTQNSYSIHEFVSKKLGIDIDTYFDSIDEVYVDSIKGEISKQKLLSILSKNLKTKSKKIEKLYGQAYKKGFIRNKELFQKAYDLKKKGYDIAILSDQWHLSKKIFTPKDMVRKFDSIVISCDVGTRKPNKKIYKLVLKHLHIKPDEAVFIDNREWNLVPAKKMKMKTILFENNIQTFKDLKKLGIK